MRKLKEILIVAALLFAPMFISCDNEDLPGAGVYQQYEVLITPTQKAAFANLRDGSATGALMEYDESALTANTRTMYYQALSANMEYNYSTLLDDAHKKCIFDLKTKGGKHLKNEIEFDAVADIVIPSELTEFRNGEALNISFVGATPQNIDIWIRSVSAGHTEFHAQKNPLNGSYTFMASPGKYDLYVDVWSDFPTLQNEGVVGGNIKLRKRAIRRDVELL